MISVMVVIAVLVWAMGSFSSALAADGSESKLQEHEYLVKKGDTFSDIAYILWMFYRVSPDKLIKWNPQMGLHYIYPGQGIKYYLPQDITEVMMGRIGDEAGKTRAQITQFEKQFRKIGAAQVIEEAVRAGNATILAQFNQFRTELQGIIEERDRAIKEMIVEETDKVRVQIGQLEKDIQKVAEDNKRTSQDTLKALTSVTGIIQGQNASVKNALDKIPRQFGDLRKDLYEDIRREASSLKDDIGTNEVVIQLSRYEKIVIGVFLVLLLVALIVWIFSIIAKKRHQPEETKEKEINLELEGVKYTYRPQVNPEGKFISLRKNKAGNSLCYKDIIDLRKSLKTSFKKEPALIEEEIKAGRLIPKS
jgi:hypothetical protein